MLLGTSLPDYGRLVCQVSLSFLLLPLILGSVEDIKCCWLLRNVNVCRGFKPSNVLGKMQTLDHYSEITYNLRNRKKKKS